jgi:hypothetical protein
MKEFPIGEIKIGKGNLEILNNTLFGPFNEGIDWMMNGETCTALIPFCKFVLVKQFVFDEGI